MKQIIIIILLFMFATLVSASNLNNSEKEEAQAPLAKPAAQGPDVAYALLNKGEISNCFVNFGQLTDHITFSTLFYNFMWPQSQGIVATGDNAWDDFSFLFARNANVVDGFTANRNEDWGPVKGHYGRYHANPQPEEFKYQGYPHLAVCDIPETWPEGYDDSTGNFVATPGERHWPGTFRLDINPSSPTYGQEVPGEFAADRVVYAALDDHDNLQNKPMGVRLDIEGYSYGRSYSADFQFYDITITNVSDSLLDNSYFGYYFDIDYGEYRDDPRWVYNSGLNPGPWDVIYGYDPEINDPNEPETGVAGTAFFKTPKDMGLTDTHFFLDTDPAGPVDDEAMWAIITSNPNDPNLPPPYTDYFHGSDVHHDDFSITQVPPYGIDWAILVATGPFDLEPGESVKSVVVVCFGENVDDFKANIEMAKNMYLKNYQGPSGPKAPKLYGVPGDGKVTLYWTSEPETTPDPFSGEYDFEGYKIYRSVDGGQSWGKQITDGTGALMGYVPVATFDQIDNVSGLDPLNSNFYLGNESGIVHTWTDTDVDNGVVYSYSITAYDRGDPANNIAAFESSKGTKETEANFVKVMPAPRALGFVDAAASYEHISGYGKGYLDIEVVDPWAITDHTYQITFSDSPAVSFNIVDVNDQNEVIIADFPINTSDMPVKDGFRVQVYADEGFGGIKYILDEYGRDVLGSDKTDTTGSWYATGLEKWGDFEAKTSNYELRFTANGTAVGTKLGKTIEITTTVPFEVWNVTYNEQITAVLLDDGDLEYEEGEKIYVVNIPYPALEIGQSYELDITKDVPYQVSVENAAQDTLKQLPIEGQLIQFITERAHIPSDMYEFSFDAFSFDAVTENELEGIRVVPNPYLVNAPWEEAKNVRRLQFMYLPPTCTISIFTTRGELVTVLHHTDNTGSQNWNLTSDSNQDLAYGIYIYVVKTPDGKEHMGKFALIK